MPFEGASLPEVITKIRQAAPEKPRKSQPAIPDAFEAIALKMLAKKPEDRYPAAKELLVDLERIAFVKHYFGADWPTRSLYHVMINTAVGNESVIETILNTMHLIEGHPKATDFEHSKVHSSI